MHKSTIFCLFLDYDSFNRSAEGVDCQNATLNDFAKINQTESIRIVGELKRWIGGGKTLNWTKTPRKNKVYLDEEQITGNKCLKLISGSIIFLLFSLIHF